MKKAVRHLLATLAFRFRKSTEKIDQNQIHMSIGKGVRSPLEILWHMRDLLNYTHLKLTTEQKNKVKSENWKFESDEFLSQIVELDSILTNREYEEEILLRLLQGPLSDALTHVGQLALLSRMMDKPVQKISYYDANMKEEKIE